MQTAKVAASKERVNTTMCSANDKVLSRQQAETSDKQKLKNWYLVFLFISIFEVIAFNNTYLTPV